MSGRKSQIDLAIESLKAQQVLMEQKVATLQHAIVALEHAKQKPKKPTAKKETEPQ